MSNKPIAIVAAGLAGGAVDILSAFVIYRPATPQQILQSVGSGLLGPASFDGGLPTAAIGLVCHFVISIIFAALFVTGAGYAPVLLRKPILSGVTFGVFAFGVMNSIVVPLSMAPERHQPAPLMLGLGLLANVLFGVAIAVVAARMLRTPKA